MLISFRGKRVNKKNVSPGKQSWGLGRRVGPRRGHCTYQLATEWVVFAYEKDKKVKILIILGQRL